MASTPQPCATPFEDIT